ncbi:unnamed protein product [Meganyctiphanes norvegica]|uniref:Peptidase S1 domain-containing protein n=1 Tax=Meganyctiphanes norvegica TaxID=48144 RepID=A0AAV2Q7N2_MEGNR
MVEYSKCQKALRDKTDLSQTFVLNQSSVCAGDQGQDACTGDGGSPLVCPDPMSPGQYVQVGAAAWGIGCGMQGVPGVYSSVAHHGEWIQRVLNDKFPDFDLRLGQ